MYIAYAPIISNSEIICKLALVPDKLTANDLAIPIKSLPTAGSAILRVGQGDCCSVKAESNFLIIRPVTPSKIFLTPDLPDKPGVSVQSLKIEHSDNDFQVFYVDARSNTDDYKKWEPTKIRL